MSIGGSARRAAGGAIGAGVVTAGMLFGAVPAAQAGPAYQPDQPATTSVAAAGLHDGPMPQHWGRHRGWWHHWWWWW